MKASWKRKWLQALRFGGYKQAQASLKSSDGKFCCLGVLCDISTENKWKEKVPSINGVVKYSFLSDEALRKFGLTDDQQHYLANMNDGGDSFKKIARYIEKTL